MSSNLLEFFKRLYVLKRVPRIGWVIAGVPKCSVESVSDHSFFVTLLAYLLSFSLEGIDKNKLLKLAIIHDLSEAIVHDIGGGARELIPRKVRKKAELEGLKKIIPDAYGQLKEEIISLWEEYELGETREARIIRVLDKLDMMIQALIYMETVSKGRLIEFFSDIDKLINECEIDEIRNLLKLIKSGIGK